MSLKIFLMLKYYGIELFDEFVTNTYDLAREFAAVVDSLPEFELAIQPDSNIVCFRALQKGYNNDELNELNSNIRNKLKENGRFYIVQTKIDNKVFLRITIMNAFTTIEILRELLQEIRMSS